MNCKNHFLSGLEANEFVTVRARLEAVPTQKIEFFPQPPSTAGRSSGPAAENQRAIGSAEAE
jgi:hypothetical protein